MVYLSGSVTVFTCVTEWYECYWMILAPSSVSVFECETVRFTYCLYDLSIHSLLILLYVISFCFGLTTHYYLGTECNIVCLKSDNSIFITSYIFFTIFFMKGLPYSNSESNFIRNFIWRITKYFSSFKCKLCTRFILKFVSQRILSWLFCIQNIYLSKGLH